MQHDEVIWGSLNRQFCSYKVKTARREKAFCRNKYNLTGLCERLSCPLANSKYGTIIENDNKLYLFIKSVERAHSPRRLWERIRLSTSYRKALTQIDKHMEYWPEFYIHKAKQRLTKMTQYIIRKRKLALQTKTRLVGINKKVERRETTREAKAQRAAKLEESIEKQLLQRLQSNAYGDIYNFDQSIYDKVLDQQAQLETDDPDLEQVELDDDDEMDEDEEESVDDDEYEAHYEDEDEIVQEDEDELADDIEAPPRSSKTPNYVFDDDEDEDDLDDDGDDDDSDDGNQPIARPRTASELDAYVRDKARRRNASNKGAPSSKAQKKKGRKLRLSNVEYEYERETAKQTQ